MIALLQGIILFYLQREMCVNFAFIYLEQVFISKILNLIL